MPAFTLVRPVTGVVPFFTVNVIEATPEAFALAPVMAMFAKYFGFGGVSSVPCAASSAAMKAAPWKFATWTLPPLVPLPPFVPFVPLVPFVPSEPGAPGAPGAPAEPSLPAHALSVPSIPIATRAHESRLDGIGIVRCMYSPSGEPREGCGPDVPPLRARRDRSVSPDRVVRETCTGSVGRIRSGRVAASHREASRGT